MSHRAIVATISDGNVQHIERRNVNTVLGVKRLAGSYKQIWMEAESVVALGGEVYTCYGEIGDTEVHVKSTRVMDES